MEPVPPWWVIEQLIQERAYLLWEKDGCKPNMDLAYWFEAEKDVWASFIEAEKVN